MLKVNDLQTNFASGELSSYLLGRSDIDRYKSGAERMENFLAKHQGPAVGRLGTANVARAAEQDEEQVVRLQDFVFSRNDAVAVEISESGFRFFRRSGLLMTTEVEVPATEMVADQEYTIQSSNRTDYTAFGAADNNPTTSFLATGQGTGDGLMVPSFGGGFITASSASGFIGAVVMINTVGTADFTAAGAPNNNVGTVFIITGGATGTGTLLISSVTGPINYVDPADAVVGQAYMISTIGGTDFTAYGAANNNSGTVFTATGPGTGSGVVLQAVSEPVVVSTIYGTDTPVPYQSSEINELQFTQSADVIFITHPNHPPATLSRYSDTDWRYEIPEFDYGPYMDQQIGDQDISLTLSGVTDRVTLTSTEGDFSGLSVDDYVEYAYRGQKVLGRVTALLGAQHVEVEPLEDRSLALSKEVYSPGLYDSWDASTNAPVYDASITGSGVSVAFSAVGVITQEHIGNYLRFSDKDGTYYWMLVTAVSDIPRQGSYGIIAVGDILAVTVPAGIVTRSARSINARLRSSDSEFFNLSTDYGRLFRLVIGEYVVHARGRAAVVRLGEMENGNQNIGMSDVSGLRVGDTVSGEDIPSGCVIEYIVADEPSYIHVSEAPTADRSDHPITINQNSTQEIGVELNRSVPRSVEGLTTVQNGTTNDWNRGAWYTGNYPCAVSFHEGRLAFAGTPAQPQTGWLSRVDDLYNFGTTDEKLRVLDDSAINFTIAGDAVNQIQWLASRGVLVVGSVGEEWKIASTTQGAALTPTTISVLSQSNHGSSYTRPIRLGKALLFLQLGGNKLRQMTYDYATDSQVSLDLNVFAEHVLKDHGSGLQLAYQQLPESVVYVRCGDGQIAAMTYEPDQQVYAWSRYIIGGPDARVESICCIPDGSKQYLFMVVSRTIDETNVRTIEVLDPEFRPTSATDLTELKFLDNHVIGGAGSATITGLDDFRGCTVNAVVDNTVHTGLSVNDAGVLVLPSVPTSRYIVGHPFTSLIKTFPIEVPAMAGTGQGKVKRINHISVRLHNTIGFKCGPSTGNLVDGYAITDPTTMTSDDKRVTFPGVHEVRGSFYIVQNSSRPITVLSLMPELAHHQ